MSLQHFSTWLKLGCGLGLAALGLVACSQLAPAGAAGLAPAPEVELPMRDTCNAQAARVVIGKMATPVVLEEARRLAGADVVRKLTPHMMITKEYRFGRLNVHVGADGRIGEVGCG